MNLKPLRGFVLVEQLDEELTTSSGLVLPETAKDKPIKGVVVEVGAGIPSIVQRERKVFPKTEGVDGMDIESYWEKITEEPPVKVGDKVVYKKWSTTDLEEDGKKLSFVAFGDILGVYEE